MKHRVGYNRLGRKSSHRKALKRNMAASLFRYERIKTTKAKALEVRRSAEKMITRAKNDSVHNRRIVGKDIKDQEVLAKLFTDIGPRYKERAGGYTRILKLGARKGDAAEMVLLELVSEEEEQPKKGKKKAKKAEKKAKPESQAAAPAATEESSVQEETAVAEETDQTAAEEPAAEEDSAEDTEQDSQSGEKDK
jgi:large subunit ribosomal protein L17